MRRCFHCGKEFGPEHCGHNVTDTIWYCSSECYDADYGEGATERELAALRAGRSRGRVTHIWLPR